MIQSKDFINLLKSSGLSQFLMVPCSIFKPLNSWMLKNKVDLIFPPNEAHAMGFATGSFLVTGKPAVVFMQNSGLNNIANAQTSLNLLYKIPVILVVSWRGEEGKKDAPEHLVMGKIMKKFLEDLQIPFVVLSNKWEEELKKIIEISQKKHCPVAVIVHDGILKKEDNPIDNLSSRYLLSRLEVIKIIKNNLKGKAVFISTNGFTSRDSFAVLPTPDFYMMGSMGHAFSIGAGVAWQLKEQSSNLRTVILDGDGGCLMHLGSLALVNLEKINKSNLIYVVLDNECYESTGIQPTLSPRINFVKVAEGLGFPQRFFVDKEEELIKVIKNLKPNSTVFIHIKINQGGRKEAPRVSDKYTCDQITKRFRKNFVKF